MSTTQPQHIVSFELRERLYEAIRAQARFAVEFEVSANNYDRPIAETPWLAEYRYGTNEYDARWYALHSANTHFNEGLRGAMDEILAQIERAAYVAGGGSS